MALKPMLLLIGLFAVCTIGIAGATETDDTIDAINDIDDSLTALEIVIEGNKDLKKLQEDPTNVTRLEEAVTKPFDIMFGGNIHDTEAVKRSMYGWMVLVIIGMFAPIIITFIKGLL